MKKFYKILLCITTLFIFSNVSAKEDNINLIENNNITYNVENNNVPNIIKLAGTDDLVITDPAKNPASSLTKTKFCNSLFGPTSKRTKLYDIVHSLIFVIRIATPAILILMSMIDFTKATGDTEKMPKAKKNAVTRLIIAVIIFMLPALIKLILTLVNLDSCNVF